MFVTTQKLVGLGGGIRNLAMSLQIRIAHASLARHLTKFCTQTRLCRRPPSLILARTLSPLLSLVLSRAGKNDRSTAIERISYGQKI